MLINIRSIVHIEIYLTLNKHIVSLMYVIKMKAVSYQVMTGFRACAIAIFPNTKIQNAQPHDPAMPLVYERTATNDVMQSSTV
jgi:hypothetical protein